MRPTTSVLGSSLNDNLAMFAVMLEQPLLCCSYHASQTGSCQQIVSGGPKGGHLEEGTSKNQILQ